MNDIPSNDRPLDDETLLGFLLRALEKEEMESVQFALEHDPKIQLRLEEMKRGLGPFELANELIEPPAGLVERTLEGIWAEVDSADDSVCQPVNDLQAGKEPVADRKVRKPSSLHLELIWLKSSWMDILVATAASIVFVSLLAPGILGSRESARREMCSNNLASLGASLVSFAELNPDRRFPSLDLQGPFAFAGSYAIRLNDIALIDRQDVLWCPSLTPTIGYRVQLPSEQQVRDAAPYRLQQWKQTAGGTYAYNLGFFDQGTYQSPTLANRTQFAIIADAPIIRGVENFFLVHSGRGINILYEDGHIAFVRLDEKFSLEDHPYFNRAGKREAGLDADDSALGPSYLQPVRIGPTGFEK